MFSLHNYEGNVRLKNQKLSSIISFRATFPPIDLLDSLLYIRLCRALY